MHVIKRNEIVRDVFRFSMYIERDHARDHDDRRRREMLEWDFFFFFWGGGKLPLTPINYWVSVIYSHELLSAIPDPLKLLNPSQQPYSVSQFPLKLTINVTVHVFMVLFMLLFTLLFTD
jgi:hypothetical protein